MKRLFVLSALVAAAMALPGVALAHGDIRDSSPAAGTEVTKPPKFVTLILAEPAAEGSTLTVTDGCQRQVSGATAIRRDIFETVIEGGEPGRWKVQLRSISAVDGHLVKDTFSFRVSGRKDCSPEGEIPAEDDETEISPDTSSRAPIDNPDQGDTSSFPVIPFALGTVAVIAVALAVRSPWKKS